MTLKAGSIIRVGLSPRLRGTVSLTGEWADDFGSIPAPAGEPYSPGKLEPSEAVYPRACGGTLGLTLSMNVEIGLSPRLRGNPRRAASAVSTGAVLDGLSPRLGGTRFFFFLPSSPRVYPRACGGTPAPWRAVSAGYGLSPRLRGNLTEGRCDIS